MSPEQASGEAIDCRSDQFSLGCVIYFMLTGRPPFRADSAMGVLNRICHHKHRPLQDVNASVPRELSRLVDRLLAKSANARFASSQACEAELSRLLSAVQSGRLRLIETRQRTRLPFKIFSALALATCALVAPFAVQSYLGDAAAEKKPAETDAQPNSTTSFAGQVEADPAVTLMESVSRHAADDPWRQSLRELSDSLQHYEQSNTSEFPWNWLQQQTLQSEQSLRSLDKQLSEIQEAMKRLPSVK
jgi:serine/threonine protein kinase